jgi:hypothetical protein
MNWDMRSCAEIRARLAAKDFDFNAFEPEIVARIERATGRTFGFDFASGTEVLS